MANREFIELFKEKKEEFRKQLEQGDFKVNGERGRTVRSSERLLDWFEKWLESEGETEGQSKSAPAMPFDEFLNHVQESVIKLLGKEDPALGKMLAAQIAGGAGSWKRFSKSWKSLNVFEDSEVFYRFGKTTPRKGPHKGEELLVFELVMDGRKKQAFLPMLERKQELEETIGGELERELPRVEATGKYRFKFFMPFDLAYRGDVKTTAEKIAQVVKATRPVLNELGVL